MVYNVLLSVRYILFALSLTYFIAFTIMVLNYDGKCQLPLKKPRRGHIFKQIFGETDINSTDVPPELPVTTPSYTFFESFPWDDYKNSLVQKDMSKSQHYTEQLLLETIQVLLKTPPTANLTCQPPPLKLPTSLVCNKLKKPRKVAMLLLQSDYNVDALEVHLNELHEVVDKFFIIESSRKPNAYLKSKPLMWDRLKYDERFKKFTSLRKMVYFVVDDSEFMQVEGSMSKTKGVIYSDQLLLEKLRWIKFLQWNAAFKYFGPDDLIGFGDVNEIPDRNNVFSLKTCEFYSYSVDIGTWVPVGEIDTASETEFSVKGHKFAYGSPTFWTIQSATRVFKGNIKSKTSTPTQMRGKSPAFLLGGMQMSNLLSFPTAVAKFLTSYDLQSRTLKTFIELGESYTTGLVSDAEIEASMQKLVLQKPITSNLKVMNMTEFRKNFLNESRQIVKIPWYMACNPERYSYMIYNENMGDFINKVME